MQRWGTGWQNALRQYWTRHRSHPSRRRCSIPMPRTQFSLKQSTLSFTWTVTQTCWYEHAISWVSSFSTARPIYGMLLFHALWYVVCSCSVVSQKASYASILACQEPGHVVWLGGLLEQLGMVAVPVTSIILAVFVICLHTHCYRY